VAAVFQDVTARKRAEAERERLLAESEQARMDAEAARTEAERATQRLQDQTVELEMQAEELQATAAHLEEKTEDAERARGAAEAARARTAGVLEAMSDGYFALDAEFRIVAVNAAMERNVGLTRDVLLGRVFWEVFPATVGTAYERHYRAAATEGATAHFTDAYDDGRLALVSEADVYPVAGGGVAVFWRDVTARVQTEGALRESEALARQLFALSPVPKWVYDAETLAFLDVNEAAVRHYGYTREEFLAMTLRDIRPAEEVPRMLAVAQAPHLRGGSQGVFRHRTKSGEVIDVEVFLRDVPYEGRRAVIAVVQDVTEHRRAEAALREASRAADEARATAEAANAAKGQFLSTMSHELRTPLNAIAGYTDLLTLGLRGPLTEAQRQDLERVRLANQHLMALVTDILNFARIDAGQIEFRPADVELATVVGELESLIGPQLTAKGIAFDHDACAADTPAAPHVVRADPEKLRQVLLNLLSNAVKFTEPGGRVSLACKTDREANVIRVQVRDTGRGIPGDQLERIFEPFVQVDRHRTHESQQGVGLGLAISRDLARGMGGDLTAESTPGVGSTFTLTLPGGSTPGS
jgi:PAS domain S-box-containing protein